MSQAQTVINHLNNNRKITSIEAIGLYGITRLSAVVHNIKKSGVEIDTTMKAGVHAPYAVYSLAAA